jgi:hypothetical protein
VKQAGRLRIAQEVRPGLDVVFREEAEVETLCLEAHLGSIEAAESTVRS